MLLSLSLLLQVALGVVAGFLLGAVWYAEGVFGSTWYRLTFPGKNMRDASGPPPAGYLFCLAALVLQSAITATVVNHLNLPVLDTVALAASVGVVVACVSGTHYIFANKPFMLFVIDESFNMVQVVAVAFAVRMAQKL